MAQPEPESPHEEPRQRFHRPSTEPKENSSETDDVQPEEETPGPVEGAPGEPNAAEPDGLNTGPAELLEFEPLETEPVELESAKTQPLEPDLQDRLQETQKIDDELLDLKVSRYIAAPDTAATIVSDDGFGSPAIIPPAREKGSTSPTRISRQSSRTELDPQTNPQVMPQAGSKPEPQSAPQHTPRKPVRDQARPSDKPTSGTIRGKVPSQPFDPNKPLPPLRRPTPTPPPVDQEGYALPRRVNELDLDATRVSPSAYDAPSPQPTRPRREHPQPIPINPPGRTVASPGRSRTSNNASAQPYSGRPENPFQSSFPPLRRPSQRRAANPPFDWRANLGCLLRFTLISVLVLVGVGMCAFSILVIQYYRIAAELPDIRDLRQRASQFETTRILDRNGNTLYEILDPSAGRRTYVTLDKISPYLVAATIATEDKGFYSHPGFDITAIIRAYLQNTQSGETVSGASTITQQLARNLLFTPEERSERTYERKIREAVLAAEITRRYSKDEILELYLNENFYGNLAYGVEAASQTYFGIPAERLTLGQASFLAGLPQAPSVYDVYTNPEPTFKRHQDVLVLMYETSQEQNCIPVSNSPQPICVDPVAVTVAADEIKAYQFRSPDIQIRYPHWVNYVRTLLEAQFDSQTIYRSGFTVYTTIDPGLQDIAQRVVSEQVAALVAHRASDGALVAIRPATGEILAMVGSADFYNEAISGQVNMAISPRQPGSAIKPLTYAAAFEKGWTPATLLWDVPTDFPPSGRDDDQMPAYTPVNYDGRFHGPVTVRYALANSYNVPAVKALKFVGIYDDATTQGEDGLIAFARRLGISSLNRADYGLALTLGGGDVSLLDLTGAYAAFANTGLRYPPVAITKILDYAGNVVYQYQQPAGLQVVRPEHAYLITSILSDNEARAPAFGADSALNLPFPAAAKTGTTNDYRDNWTMGYTPDLAIGVWVGNADYSAMENTTGLTGAAPIWASFMTEAIQQITGGNPTPFTRPGGIVEQVICDISGTLPSEWCPTQRREIFVADQPPLPKEQDLWQKVNIDTWTGLTASADCPDFTNEQYVLNVTDQAARRWLRRDPQGQAWAEEMEFDNPLTFTPERECKASDPRPLLGFSEPGENETVLDHELAIVGTAGATQWFDYWRLDYGLGSDPVEWQPLEQSREEFPTPGELYFWDLTELVVDEDLVGPLTLRLTVFSTEETYAETFLHLNIQVPRPTPTETPTPLPTETPAPTATFLPPPTFAPPTAVPPTAELPTAGPPSTEAVPSPQVLPTDTPVVFTEATPTTNQFKWPWEYLPTIIAP